MACPVERVKRDIGICITGFYRARDACSSNAFKQACTTAIRAMANARRLAGNSGSATTPQQRRRKAMLARRAKALAAKRKPAQ